MNELAIIIIEDNQAASEHLKELLRSHQEFKLLAIATTVQEGKRLIAELKPDVVFLDIMLPDGMGFEIFEGQTAFKPFFTVCMSGFESADFRQKAFDYESLHFLPKPITQYRIDEVFQRIKKRNFTPGPGFAEVSRSIKIHSYLNDDGLRYVLRTRDEHIWIKVMNIVFIRGGGSQTFFQLKDAISGVQESLESGLKLKTHQTGLSHIPFLIQINRSTIVNTFRIESYLPSDQSLLMATGDQLSVSKKYAEFLQHRMEYAFKL